MAKHHTPMTDTGNLDRLIEQGITVPEIADKLGMANSTIYTYVRETKMPKHASVACEGLLRRMSKAATTYLLVEVPTVHVKTIKEIIGSDAFKGQIANLSEFMSKRGEG